MNRKTTVYLPDDLLRELKIEAAERRCSVSDILVERARRSGGRGSQHHRPRPAWIGSFSSDEITSETSEEILRAELGRSS